MKLINRIEIAKDFMQNMVDHTVNTVQSTHNIIADSSYKLLSMTPASPVLLEELKERHDQMSGEVYNTIRSVNQQLGSLASDAFESIEDSRAADRVMNQVDQSSADTTKE